MLRFRKFTSHTSFLSKLSEDVLQQNREREGHGIKETMAATWDEKEAKSENDVLWWPRESPIQIRAGGETEEGVEWERRWFQRSDSTLEKDKVFKAGHARGEMKKSQRLLEKQKIVK